MADSWLNWFGSSQHSETLIHPDAPAGGSGPGNSRRTGPQEVIWPASIPHPYSPAGRWFSWDRLIHIVPVARARAVLDALRTAPRYVPHAIKTATGQELHNLVSGIIPGLLFFLGILAATTTFGAAAGAVVGALAGGVGAIPGAAVGAEAGLDVGLAILDFLGLAFLAGYIGHRLLEAAKVAGHAVTLAWHSVDNPTTEARNTDIAAHRFAHAVGLVFRGLLQGIVAYLMAKGANAAAARVPELVSKLRASKLGAGFAEWIERNWIALLKEPKLRPEKTSVEQAGTGGDAGAASTETGGKLSSLREQGSARRVQSRKDIDTYQSKYQAQEDAARQAGNNRSAGGYKAKVTEARGERAATDYMEQNHPDFVMDKGFKPGQGFDQVYTKYDADGNPVEMMIVEAKGPGATLSTNAAKGPQMSQRWVEKTIDDMTDSNDPNTRALGQRLQDALDDGEPPITGKVIQALPAGGAQEVPLPNDAVYNGGRYN